MEPKLQNSSQHLYIKRLTATGEIWPFVVAVDYRSGWLNVTGWTLELPPTGIRIVLVVVVHALLHTVQHRRRGQCCACSCKD